MPKKIGSPDWLTLTRTTARAHRAALADAQRRRLIGLTPAQRRAKRARLRRRVEWAVWGALAVWTLVMKFLGDEAGSNIGLAISDTFFFMFYFWNDIWGVDEL